MGYYLGQFYFDKRDLFIVLAIIVLLAGYKFGYPLPYFEYKNLIILAILFLFAKGFDCFIKFFHAYVSDS